MADSRSGRWVCPADRPLLSQLEGAVRDAVYRAADEKGTLRLYFVTLTFATVEQGDWHPYTDGNVSGHDSGPHRDTWIRQAADCFIGRIEREHPNAGCLLVYHQEQGRHPHWHGIVLTALSPHELDERWHVAASHCQISAYLNQRVKHVRWSVADDWYSVVDRRSRLRTQFRQMTRYMAEALPDAMTLRLADRYLVSGSIAETLAFQQEVQAERGCHRPGCHRLIPDNRRKDSQFCDERCQRIAGKRTARTRKRSAPTHDVNFAETQVRTCGAVAIEQRASTIGEPDHPVLAGTGAAHADADPRGACDVAATTNDAATSDGGRGCSTSAAETTDHTIVDPHRRTAGTTRRRTRTRSASRRRPYRAGDGRGPPAHRTR